MQIINDEDSIFSRRDKVIRFIVKSLNRNLYILALVNKRLRKPVQIFQRKNPLSKRKCVYLEKISSQQYVEFIAKNSRVAKSDGDLVMRTWEFQCFSFPVAAKCLMFLFKYLDYLKCVLLSFRIKGCKHLKKLFQPSAGKGDNFPQRTFSNFYLNFTTYSSLFGRYIYVIFEIKSTWL